MQPELRVVRLTVAILLAASGILWAPGVDAAPRFTVMSASTTRVPVSSGSTATVSRSATDTGTPGFTRRDTKVYPEHMLESATDHSISRPMWNNRADPVIVAQASPSVAFSIGTISVQPTSIQPGRSVSIRAPVTNTGTSTANGVIVRLHVTNPSGQDFANNQVIISGQSF